MPEVLDITDTIADVGIGVAVLACAAFVVSYWTFFNWRLTAAGRSLMYFVLALLSVAVISFLARWLGPTYWGREFFRPVTWWAVAITAIRLTVVLWTSSRRGNALDIPSRPRDVNPRPEEVTMTTTANVPEIWYKTQRALRSIVGSLVVLIPLANGVAAAAIAYLTAQTDVIVDPVVFVWLNAVVAVTALIIGLVSRIMAVPGVNEFLTRIGLGSVPKDAVSDVTRTADPA